MTLVKYSMIQDLPVAQGVPRSVGATSLSIDTEFIAPFTCFYKGCLVCGG